MSSALGRQSWRHSRETQRVHSAFVVATQANCDIESVIPGEALKIDGVIDFLTQHTSGYPNVFRLSISLIITRFDPNINSKCSGDLLGSCDRQGGPENRLKVADWTNSYHFREHDVKSRGFSPLSSDIDQRLLKNVFVPNSSVEKAY